METPSGEEHEPAGFNVENREALSVFKCSRCGQNISLVSAQEIRSTAQIIQDHLELCLRSRSTREFLKPTTARNNNIDPLDLLMPLQPRRTWSAEDERRRRLEADPDAYDVGPHSVTCRGCHRPIRLNATGRYYAANWNKHKMGCKIANNVDGGGPSSLESKFTGRVAAFRVSNPTAEGSDTSLHSPTTISAARPSSVSPRIPQQALHPSPEETNERAPSSWRGQPLGHPRYPAGNNSLNRQVIRRDVELRSSPAASYAHAQASPFGSSTTPPHALSEGPHPASFPSAGTPFSTGEYENETHRELLGPFGSQASGSQAPVNDPGGVPRAERVSAISRFEGHTIRRDQREPDFTNQLTGHDTRRMRDDSTTATLMQTSIRGAFASASNSRRPETAITDSSSSSTSSSPFRSAATLERERRRLSSSGNFTHHSATIMPSHQVGNRLQTSDGLENRAGLSPPQQPASSTLITTRFASNAPPYSDNKTIFNSPLSGTLFPSSSASSPRGGNDTGQTLPSLSSLTRDLPQPGHRAEAVGSRDPPRSSSTGPQGHYRPSSRMETPPLSNSLILPPLHFPPPSTSLFRRRQLDSEPSVEQDSPSPKRVSVSLGNTPIRQGTSLRSYTDQSSRSLATSTQQGQFVSSSPRSDHVRLGRGSLRSIPGPSIPRASASQTPILVEDNKGQHGARLHPVWKWEKGKNANPDPKQHPRTQGEFDSDNEMDT